MQGISVQNNAIHFLFLHISGALKDAARMPCSHSTVEAAVEVLPSGAARQTAGENHSDTLREENIDESRAR